MDCFICSFPHSVCGENKKNCIYEEWRKDEMWWKDMDWLTSIAIRKIMWIFFAVGGFYFVVQSTRIPEDKMITIPLYFFCLVLAGWFCSLGMEMRLCNKRVKYNGK